MKKQFLAASALFLLTSGAALAVPTHDYLRDSIDGALENVAGSNVSNQQVAAQIGGGDISAVPLPAAGWMLLAGLGGIVALRRRAKA
jgi:hypothetical protein